MQTTMCEEWGETGHSANKCPIRPCNACGKWGPKYCAVELEIDHLELHPARVCAADLRRSFYFVDEHSNFDSD